MKKLPALWLIIWAALALAFARADLSYALAHTLGRATLVHPLGYDSFGRDLLVVTAQASLLSALFAALTTAASLALGTGAGAALAIAPPLARFSGQRALELLLAFPGLLFALAYAAVQGPGWDTLIFALLIGTLPSVIRLMSARAREVLQEDYVLAARSFGAASPWIVLRHLLPVLASTARVLVPNLFAHALLAEATLSFLGIGAPVGRDTWGSLLAQAKDYLIESPHLAIGVGFPLVLTILSLQILSENPQNRVRIS